MKDLKIAAQLYSVREYCQTEQDVYRTFERIREMGFDGVEIEGLRDVLPAEKAAACLRSLGLAVCATRARQGEAEACPQLLVQEALCYGAEECGIGTIKSLYLRSDATVAQYDALIAPAAEQIRRAGLTPAYAVLHHDFMPCRDILTLAQGRQDAPGQAWQSYHFTHMLNHYAPGEMNLTLDTLWLVQAGVYVPDVIRQAAGRSRVIRFRDWKIEIGPRSLNHPSRTPCEVGGGLLDFASYLPAIRDAGIRWITVGQELAARDPFECLQLGLAHVTNLLETAADKA